MGTPTCTATAGPSSAGTTPCSSTVPTPSPRIHSVQRPAGSRAGQATTTATAASQATSSTVPGQTSTVPTASARNPPTVATAETWCPTVCTVRQQVRPTAAGPGPRPGPVQASNLPAWTTATATVITVLSV